MKKAIKLCGLIIVTIAIISLLAGHVSAEAIIIDTEKGVPGFWTEPARDLPSNWWYLHDHPDSSSDGWFDTRAYPTGQGNGTFWYTISFPDMDECKGIWETSVQHTGKYEVFAWIPSPDSFDPYLDESTPPSDYLPTKRAQYKVFHNDGVDTVSIDQNVNMGRFTSLGVFVFDSTARVELSSNGVEFWRCVAFDAVKFVPVVNDMAVTDVSIMPPTVSVGQSTAICVTVTNEGSQQEDNVSVKAFVDGAQVGSTKSVSLDPGASDTRTILWIPSAAKNYSVEGVVGVVNGETDTGDNTKAIEERVSAMSAPVTTAVPIRFPPQTTHTDETTNDKNANKEAFDDTPLGKIVFASDRSGNSDIWVMNADGSDVARLTDNPATDGSPKWSHDGTKIAFASNRGGTWHIWIMDADGSNQWQLTPIPVGEPSSASPAWYPDDQKIAFTANNGHSIYSINIDGSGLTEIIPPQGSPWPAPRDPDISPDGSKFVLVMKFSGWGHDIEIFSADIDGSNLAQLTNTSGYWEESQCPAWSPNGDKILFEGIRAWDDNHRNLYTMDPDGSDQTMITSFTTTSPQANDLGSPRWSPDGEKIVFVAKLGSSDYEIYTINKDGSNLVDLTNNPACDYSPDWLIIKKPADVELTLYIEDAIAPDAPEDAPPLVNKAPGDIIDIVAQVMNKGDEPYKVDVTIEVPAGLIYKKCFSRSNFMNINENHEDPVISGNKYTVTIILGTKERQIVWRFKIPDDEPTHLCPTLVGLVEVNGVKCDESTKRYSMTDNTKAIIVTNRHLLFKKYGDPAGGSSEDVRDLLNYLYQIGDDRMEDCIIYYVDHEDEDLENWNQEISDADYNAGETCVNEVSNADEIDDFIEKWAEKTNPPYLMIVGGDEVIPFYRRPFRPISLLLNEEKKYNNNDPVLSTYDHNYYLTDMKYADLDDDHWDQGSINLAMGRIVGASASDMGNFIRNGLEEPPVSSENAIMGTIHDGSEFYTILSKLRSEKKFDILNDDELPVTVHAGGWSENDFLNLMGNDFSIFIHSFHGDYYKFDCPSSYIVTKQITEIATISQCKPFFITTACHSGIITNYAAFPTRYQRNLAYALAHQGARGFIGLTSYGLYEKCLTRLLCHTSLSQRILNEFFDNLITGSDLTNPVGTALRDTIIGYDKFNGFYYGTGDELTVTEFHLYGVPWMRIDPPISTLTQEENKGSIRINVSEPQFISKNTFKRVIEVNVSNYTVSVIDGFDLVNINGSNLIIDELKPILPGTHISLDLPKSSNITGLSMNNNISTSIGHYNIPCHFSTVIGSNDTGIINCTNITGFYPSPIYNSSFMDYDDYKKAGIDLALIQYNPETNETILYNYTKLELTYQTPITAAITDFSLEKTEYTSGEQINASVTIENVGSNALAGLRANLSLKDSHGIVKASSVCASFDVASGDSKTVYTILSQNLPHGTYLAGITVINGTGDTVGNSSEYIYISTGGITGFFLPNEVELGGDITFNITFENSNTTSVEATGVVYIYDPHDIEVANLPSLPVTVAIDSEELINITWSTVGKEIGEYKAAAYVFANGEAFGPEYRTFEIKQDMTTLYYPDFTDTNTPGNWRTWLGVMNTGDASTTLNLTIYNQDGSIAYSNPDFVTLEPKAVHFFRPGMTAGIAQGSAIVSGNNLAGTCHVNKNGGEGTKAYTALSSGSSTLNYPDFTDTDISGNWRTWMGVMNTGATSTTVRLDVYNADGSLAYSNANFVTLEPKAAHFFRPGITAGIAQGDVVVSGDNLVGTCHVNRNGGEGTKVYTAIGG